MDNNEVQQNPEVVTGQVAQEAVEATVQPVAETVSEAIPQPAVDVAPAVEPQPAVEAVPAVVPQPEAQPAPVVAAKATKAPAKEIVSMILGITSLCSGVCAIGFAWVPVTGLICAFVFGTIAIGESCNSGYYYRGCRSLCCDHSDNCLCRSCSFCNW